MSSANHAYLFSYPYFLSLLPQNEGKESSEESEQHGAIISNHISYLDILYHMSSSFPSFVAKVGQ